MGNTVDFMGLPLKNPVIVAAGPWSGGAAGIQKCVDAGAAAVVTETFLNEELPVFGPRIYYRDGQVLNLSLYGHRSLEDWEEELERVDRRDSFLICSIRGSSPSELAYVAQKAERMGADGLQLDIFAPMGAVLEEINVHPEKLYKMAHAVVQAVQIPVMVRLPYHISATTAYVRAVEQAGVSAISTIESLRALSGVDVEKRTSVLPTYGGYTGPHIRPVSLAATAMLAQITNSQICSVGGVEDYRNVLEFLMLGARTVQLGSTIMLNGYERITETVRNLEAWMEEHGEKDYEQLSGAALSSLQPYEQVAKRERRVCLSGSCRDADCSLCVRGCMYGALQFRDGRLRSLRDRCSGCGLCVQRCPGGLLHLE